MKSLFILSLATVSLLLTACGGEGDSSNYASGKLCPLSYVPYPMKAVGTQTAVVLDENTVLPAGTYTYEQADLYFVDKATDLRIHLTNAIHPNEKVASTKPTCMRKAFPGMTGMSVETLGITDLEVPAGAGAKLPIIDVRQFSLSIENSKMTSRFDLSPGKIAGSPKDVYKKSNATEVLLIKTSETEYELRSTGENANGTGTYVLNIKLKFTPATAIEPPPAP